MIAYGAQDVNDALQMISGLDIFQSGQKGQQTSILLEDQSSIILCVS